MRSTGRRQDLVLSGPGALRLRSAVAAKGQDIFNDPAKGKCFGCHLNAGASVDGIHNANFDTGVANLPSQPADLLDPDQPNPPDGGFGTAPGPVWLREWHIQYDSTRRGGRHPSLLPQQRDQDD